MKKHKVWMLALMAVAIALFAGRVCHAAGKNCSLGDKIINGFALTAGFRWDKECAECQPSSPCTPPPGSPTANNVDPAFVGVELRVPISQRTTLGGNFDRDWTEAPDWNARVYVAFAPWKRHR